MRTADVLVEAAARRRVAAGHRLRHDQRHQSEARLRQHFLRPEGSWALRPASPDGAGHVRRDQRHRPARRRSGQSGIPIADLGAALFATYAILSAIIGRGKTGKGCFIDASLFEAALGLSIWETTELWGTGLSPAPIGTANRMSAPYQAVKASDGYFVLGAANQKLWLAFLEVAGREDLARDPRFATNTARLEHQHALMAELHDIFGARTVTQWVDALLEARMLAGPI